MQTRKLILLMRPIFLVWIYLFIFNSTVDAQSKTLEGNNTMYNIPMTTLDGKKMILNDTVGGKPVYLKFWASWCQPCRKQMPHLQKTFEKYGDKIEVITVNLGINDSLEEIAAIQKEFSLTAPIMIDHSGKLSQAFNLIGTPYHVLIDRAANIVFTSHDASSQLDKTIQLLSASEVGSLPSVSIEPSNAQTTLIKGQENKSTALFFTSTWCDWYLKESRPSMSKNCIQGQNLVNTLYKGNPGLSWTGVVSRLWTGEKELKEYKDKYQIEYPLIIDVSDQAFIKYNVKNFPTLVLLQAGKEVFRTTDFSDPGKLSNVVNNFQKEIQQ